MKQILDIYAGNRVDLAHEQATGTDGVLIKGGQGQWPEYFARHSTFIDQCKALGLPYGIYWQMDARYSPESHKAALKQGWPDGDFGALGLWLACEKPFYPCPDWLYNRLPYHGYKPIMSVWNGMMDFCVRSSPGIYTSIGMWRLIFAGAPKAIQQTLVQALLWVAQYKVTAPTQIGAWPFYDLWQYTENPDYSIATQDWWDQCQTGKTRPDIGSGSFEPSKPSSPPSPRPLRRLRRPDR